MGCKVGDIGRDVDMYYLQGTGRGVHSGGGTVGRDVDMCITFRGRSWMQSRGHRERWRHVLSSADREGVHSGEGRE